VEALSRRTLATELGCGVNTVRRLVDPSVDLAVLAADEVVTRRRQGRWGRRAEDPFELASQLVRRLLPEDTSHIDEELVWMKLVAATQVGSRSGEAPGRVRHDFQVAQRGWADDDLDDDVDEDEDYAPGSVDGETPVGARPPTGGEGLADARAAALAHHLDARRTEIDSTIRTILTVLGLDEEGQDEDGSDRDVEALRLEALVQGLTTAVCTGEITPEQALDTMDRHLAELGKGTARVAG
jgi:hypothetical protein